MIDPLSFKITVPLFSSRRKSADQGEDDSIR
jgi:hypothetical protein